jgi:hypothetical protein
VPDSVPGAEPESVPVPGLQAERTALAWQRSGLSGAALAGSAAVAAAHLGAPWVLVAVSLLAALCASAVVAAVRLTRAPTPWSRLLAMAAIPVLLAFAGILLSLPPHPS